MPYQHCVETGCGTKRGVNRGGRGGGAGPLPIFCTAHDNAASDTSCTMSLVYPFLSVHKCTSGIIYVLPQRGSLHIYSVDLEKGCSVGGVVWDEGSSLLRQSSLYIPKERVAYIQYIRQ